MALSPLVGKDPAEGDHNENIAGTQPIVRHVLDNSNVDNLTIS